MPPTLAVGLIVLGGVLLLVSIIGGKFKIFGAEVTETISNWQLRLLAGVLGIVFVLTAVFQPSLTLSGAKSGGSPDTLPKVQRSVAESPVKPAITTERPKLIPPQQKNSDTATKASEAARKPGAVVSEEKQPQDLADHWFPFSKVDSEQFRSRDIQLYNRDCQSVLAYDKVGTVSSVPVAETQGLTTRFFVRANSDETLSFLTLPPEQYGLSVNHDGVRMLKFQHVATLSDDLKFRTWFPGNPMVDAVRTNYAQGNCKSETSNFLTLPGSARLIEPVTKPGRVLFWTKGAAALSIQGPPEQIGVPGDFESSAVVLLGR